MTVKTPPAKRDPSLTGGNAALDDSVTQCARAFFSVHFLVLKQPKLKPKHTPCPSARPKRRTPRRMLVRLRMPLTLSNAHPKRKAAQPECPPHCARARSPSTPIGRAESDGLQSRYSLRLWRRQNDAFARFPVPPDAPTLLMQFGAPSHFSSVRDGSGETADQEPPLGDMCSLSASAIMTEPSLAPTKDVLQSTTACRTLWDRQAALAPHRCPTKAHNLSHVAVAPAPVMRSCGCGRLPRRLLRADEWLAGEKAALPIHAPIPRATNAAGARVQDRLSSCKRCPQCITVLTLCCLNSVFDR